MYFHKLINASKLKLIYKDNSPLIKLLSLFNNKDFMTHEITIIRDIVYVPNEHFLKIHPIASVVLFLYALVKKKLSKKEAYLSSLYVINKLSQTLHFVPHLEIEGKNLIKQLEGNLLRSKHKLEQEFSQAIQLIKINKRPFEDKIFDIIDDLLSKL